MDVPNCAMVLNTAPARPWVFGLNESAIIKLATVKITAQRVSDIAFQSNHGNDYHLPKEVQGEQPRMHSTTMTTVDQ
jgi:hypothetical protein